MAADRHGGQASPRTARHAPAAGFTLLEVMIAIAILGLSLSAILSAQAGMYSTNIQARNVTHATSAARCKMSEVEEDLLKNGYLENDKFDEGNCCADDPGEGMTCKWSVERVTLPDPPQADTSADGGGIGFGAAGLGGDAGGGGLGALGGLAQAATDPSAIADGGISGLTSMLAGSGNGGVGGGAGIAGMALTMVYPQLKPLLEASIRRITVEVVWHEGTIERTLKVVQFVTNPNKGLPAFDPSMLAGDAGPLLDGGPAPGATTPGAQNPAGAPPARVGL